MDESVPSNQVPPRPRQLPPVALSTSLHLFIKMHFSSSCAHTLSHVSQYGSALGNSGASSSGQCSQRWTGVEQVYCCQQGRMNTQTAIWDELHIYVIILKTWSAKAL